MDLFQVRRSGDCRDVSVLLSEHVLEAISGRRLLPVLPIEHTEVVVLALRECESVGLPAFARLRNE